VGGDLDLPPGRQMRRPARVADQTTSSSVCSPSWTSGMDCALCNKFALWRTGDWP
jgi:hypothetical protein